MGKGVIIIEGLGAIEGEVIGADIPAFGELVFTTSPSGYIKSLTDPSYKGQILVFSFPYIGAYGTRENGESTKAMVNGAIFSHVPEYKRAELDDFLKINNVPGLIVKDTRRLIDYIRINGNKLAVIGYTEILDPYKFNLVDEGIWKDAEIVGGEVLVVDLGIKGNILEELKDFKVDIIPYKYFKSDLSSKYRGIVVSNGPGDPAHESLKGFGLELRKAIGTLPILGICLGHQIISLNSGLRTYKMKFGHRSINHPVEDLGTGRIGITTHNHGFAVEFEDGHGLDVGFLSLNDGTIEGLYGKKLITVQFHPEGGPGPKDELGIFKKFRRMIGNE